MRAIGKWAAKPLCTGLAAIVCVLAAWAGSADAAWRFDTERYLRSYHGDLSCVACHKDVVNAEVHPDAKNVNHDIKEFFSAKECFVCHGHVKALLDQGKHGRLKVTNAHQYDNCLTCHHPHYDGAFNEDAKPHKTELAPNDAACMTCHQSPTGNLKQDQERNRQLCFHCHMKDNPAGWHEGPLVDPEQYKTTPHATMDCMTCHVEADKYPHGVQTYGDCTACHTQHDESVSGDAHMNVACESCHLSGVTAEKKGDMIGWVSSTPMGKVTPVHQMRGVEEEACGRCHVAGNTVGASSWALPPKSIICMGCHAATVSAGDTISVVSLLIFLAGIILFFGAALTGGRGGLAAMPGAFFQATGSVCKAVFSGKCKAIGNTLFYDVLLQRRLWKRSQSRWIIHSLIFLPFAFRFVWGLVALVLSNVAPAWSLTWYFVNKNAPGTAFLFDVSGALIFIGLIAAFMRGQKADKTKLQALPSQDILALGLIAGTVFIGFILEGMRIAMTGFPAGSEWAFIGTAIGALFGQAQGVNAAYGWVWYLHALFTGAFIAYLPFSRLMHIIMAPIVLSMNAAKDDH